MTLYHCNPGAAHWGGPYAGSFRPQGGLKRHGRDRSDRTRNPVLWDAEDTLAGRLFVGFSVGDKPVYTIDDLIPIVQSVREEQVGDPSASFVMQKGIYKHRVGGEVVVEDGAQVIVFADSGADSQAFTSQLVELAEEIAREMRQEAVIVEVQKNGIVQRLLGVGP